MEMFLTALVMSVLGTVVCAALFAAATRGERVEALRPAQQPELAPQRFFASAAAAAPASQPAAARAPQDLVPVEALLLQIEQHIRLEQAAAESFLHTPSGQSLQSRTTSPLVH
jgi:hypothetical protein